jgi:ubiquinone/menaquinone biosynthesis C-methylase UbiE
MNQDKTREILAEIETGYDMVSGKFSETRKYFWRGLEFIGDYTKDGDSILDFGCGNGRLLELMADKSIKYWGVDVSNSLINLAQERYYSKDINFSKIDPRQISLPFEDNFFNAVYSIAVFHHLPSKKHRKDIIKELYRIAKPGGCVIITVWNLWQRKYIKNILKNWMQKIAGKSSLDWNDAYIPFKDNWGKTFQRYHHAYTKGELADDFAGAGFVKKKVIGGRNIIFIGEKPLIV